MFRRSGSLLLLLALTGCFGTFMPVKVRPGSDVALPDNGSWVGDIVNGLACSKDKSRNPRKGGNPLKDEQCGQGLIDPIPQRIDSLPTPPAKRP